MQKRDETKADAQGEMRPSRCVVVRWQKGQKMSSVISLAIESNECCERKIDRVSDDSHKNSVCSLGRDTQASIQGWLTSGKQKESILRRQLCFDAIENILEKWMEEVSTNWLEISFRMIYTRSRAKWAFRLRFFFSDRIE